jgi:PAS domain S-box-containing protein
VFLTSPGYGQVQTKRVLILTGYDPSHPAVSIILQNITSTIRSGSKDRVEFFYEFQENIRIPNSKYESEMVGYLQRKYEGENISLVLTLGAPALKFLLDHESEVFSQVPKIYYFHDQREEIARSLWPRVTGVWANLELSKDLEMALELQPDTRSIFVVSGNSAQDKFLRDEAQIAFRDYQDRLRFTYLTDLTIEELRSNIAALPPHTVVIYLSFFADRMGNSFSGPEALSVIAPTSSAPIYGISETYMGAGIVGGALLDFELLGKTTGQLALRVMAGEKPENIAPQTVPTVARFDFRQLQRWGLPQRKLPANAILEFQTPTLWALYKWYILVAVAAFLVQVFLIVSLLINRNRRRKTELESHRLAHLAEAEHKRLDELVSNVPGVVWETRIDPATGELKTTFVSDHVRKMLGYTADEWISTPGFGLKIVHELDREMVASELARIVSQGEERILQFRWLTSKGRTVSVEAHLAPIIDDDGKTVGVRGVTLDITEQQVSEEAHRQSEERNRALLQAVPDLMFLQTRDGVYLDYHAKDTKVLALPPGGFLGKNMSDVLPTKLAEAFLKRFKRAETGESQILEFDLQANGTHGWFEARIVRTGDNILSMVRDVSARKLSEIALTQNEAQLARIIGSALDAIITVDKDHKIVVFNAAAERLFLCSAADALSQSFDRFLPERFRNEHNLNLFGENETSPNAMGLRADLYGLRASGEEFPIEASISYIDLNGQQFYTVIIRDITERKRALDELRLSRERFAKAFRSNPQPMSLTTLDGGRYLDVNESFLQMSGYTRSEVIGHTSLELRIWETPEARDHLVNQLKELGSLVNMETRFRTKQGSFRILLSSAEQLDIAGQQCLLMASSDITERVAAQQALRETEVRFRILADSSPVLIWINGLEGCEFVNRSYLEFVGRSIDDVLGMEWSTAVHPDDMEAYLDNYNQAFQKRGHFEDQFRFRRADGEYRWFKSIALPRFTPDGTFLGYVGSSVDVSDIKNSEEALRESEERFRNLADTAPVMIWIADEKQASTYLNAQWLDFTGRSLDEELGTGWTKGVHPEDYEHCLQAYSRNFDQRKPFEVEYRHLGHDGQYHWVYGYGKPRFSADGVFLGYIGSALDITERKEAEVALQKTLEELKRLKNQLEAENIYLQEELLSDNKTGEIVGQSSAIKYVLFKVTQVARTDSTVLITGETGVGKELVARAIHGESLRKDRPLIKINCGALVPTLIESELFGHEKGSFTGASNRKLGRFELANGGTIFLDEIGELSLELQVKLLRVIQENEFERLGGTKTIRVNVRVIAATNRDLKREVELGKFREDLWYRLNVYPINVPPLRQRKEDIPLLVEHFVSRSAKKAGKTISEISPRAMQMLQTHSWPGNVRELANVIERAVIHTQGTVLQLVDRFEPVEKEQPSLQTLEELEHDYILRTLENTGWRIEGQYGAAKILGLNPSTLRTRMLKLGIQRRRATVI